MQARIRELKEQGPPSLKPETLDDLLRRWLTQHAERHCSPKTVERYRQLLEYVSPDVLSQPLDAVNAMALEAEMHRLRESGGKKRNPGLAPKTVRNVFAIISAALTRAVGWGLLKASPAVGVQLPKAERKESRALNPAQTQHYLDVARGHWLYPILQFASATGCRRGEILALTWGEVNFEDRFVSIVRSLEQTKQGLRIKTPKNGKARLCPLPPSVLATLQAHRAEQEKDRAMFGQDYRADLDLVFADVDGNYRKPDTVTAAACLMARKAGFKKVGLHSLRHSHGSHLLSAGVSLPTVSKRLGHADPAITARVYAHSFTRDEVEAAEVWDRLMEKGQKPLKTVQ